MDSGGHSRTIIHRLHEAGVASEALKALLARSRSLEDEGRLGVSCFFRLGSAEHSLLGACGILILSGMKSGAGRTVLAQRNISPEKSMAFGSDEDC